MEYWPRGEDAFRAAVLAGQLGDPAGFGFLAVGDGDGLSGALGDGVGPGAIVHTSAAHGVGLADFKLFHVVLLSGGGPVARPVVV